MLSSCRDPGDTCVLPSFCVVVATFTFEVSGQEMGSVGFQTQKSESWIAGKERAEKVLAGVLRTFFFYFLFFIAR